MNESLFLNKISYQNEQEKNPNYFFWISIIITILLIITSSISVRLSIKIATIYNEETNTLEMMWDYEKVNQLNQFEKIKIDEVEHSFHILNMSEIKVMRETNWNYQIVEIESPRIYHKNQVVYILLCDKKEKIIKKLKKIIIGG